MFELKVFQENAAKQIYDRYKFFKSHEYRPRKGDIPRPFFQALSSLTGSGKTPILARAVDMIQGNLEVKPIVIWISKAKSVVEQTYANFSDGGKYKEIIKKFRVVDTPHISPELISDGRKPLMIVVTTGLFNNKDESKTNLNIYKKEGNADHGGKSPWDRLVERSIGDKERRPLIVVYDEGHNLSEQQTEILAKMEPEAYLLASATLRLPENFNDSVVKQIETWVKEARYEVDEFRKLNAVDDSGKPSAEKFIVTAIDSAKVVDAQLVKRSIQFDGTTSTMERCVDDLLDRLDVLDGEIRAQGLNFKPKAIYVCKTNIADDGEKDDHSKPFAYRKAPPILIWRYLVEKKGIDPASVAIYANLSFSDGNKPQELNLFSNGENDFDDFTSGNYQHIIFNLSLQEGWDDPACYLAYIDKSMGSKVQVEQVIGRVLRQYGAKHYDSPLLNSAHFFLRVDNQNVFSDAIQTVKNKLCAEGAPIEIFGSMRGPESKPEDLLPKTEVQLCHINVDAEEARGRIANVVNDFRVYKEDDQDVLGQAHVASKTVDIKSVGDNDESLAWIAKGNTNAIRLRWLINTEMRSRSTRALSVTDLGDRKFDVRVQVGSRAHKEAVEMVNKIVKIYYEFSELVYESMHPFAFGKMVVPANAPKFENSLYERYSGLNGFEHLFAQALDKTGYLWHRNSSYGGFRIPLISEGDSSSFFPDFIVWKDDMIYCLDTKGSHLLSDAVARKLFDIQEDGKTRIKTRFISEGRQKHLREKPAKGGYTVWKMKSGNPVSIGLDSMEEAVVECLR